MAKDDPKIDPSASVRQANEVQPDPNKTGAFIPDAPPEPQATVDLPKVVANQEGSVDGAPLAPLRTNDGFNPDVEVGEPLEIGDTGGARYIKKGELGKGGMGTVLWAYDTLLKRDVAIKEINPAKDTEAAAKATDQLVKEAQAIAIFGRHSNIVTVHDMVQAKGKLWIVFEYMSGGTLEKKIKDRKAAKDPITGSFEVRLEKLRKSMASDTYNDTQRDTGYAAIRNLITDYQVTGNPLEDKKFKELLQLKYNSSPEPFEAFLTEVLNNINDKFHPIQREKTSDITPREAASIVYKIAGALHFVHEQGYVHRDVKPPNILLDKYGEVYLADFGVLMPLAGGLKPEAGSQRSGTPSYMSPEHADGGSGKTGEVGPHSDVFSLGIVLHELLSGGKPLFPGTKIMAIMKKIADTTQPLPEPTNDGVKIPKELKRICMKALGKDPSGKRPEKRYETAKEMADDLHKFLNPVRSRTLEHITGALLATTLLSAGAGVLFTVYGRNDTPTPLEPETSVVAKKKDTPPRRLRTTQDDMDEFISWPVGKDKYGKDVNINIFTLLDPAYKEIVYISKLPPGEPVPEVLMIRYKGADKLQPNQFETYNLGIVGFLERPRDSKELEGVKQLMANLDAVSDSGIKFSDSKTRPFNSPLNEYQLLLKANDLEDSPELRLKLKEGIESYKKTLLKDYYTFVEQQIVEYKIIDSKKEAELKKGNPGVAPEQPLAPKDPNGHSMLDTINKLKDIPVVIPPKKWLAVTDEPGRKKYAAPRDKSTRKDSNPRGSRDYS